jgi:hypothetical protein
VVARGKKHLRDRRINGLLMCTARLPLLPSSDHLTIGDAGKSYANRSFHLNAGHSIPTPYESSLVLSESDAFSETFAQLSLLIRLYLRLTPLSLSFHIARDCHFTVYIGFVD